MAGRSEYGYNGYSGQGYSQHVNQPTTNSTQQSLGYQYLQPPSNYSDATSGDYFSGRSVVAPSTGRVPQATSDSYSNRNTYDPNSSGHLAYGGTGTARQYASPTIMAPQPTHAHAQTQQSYGDSNAARLAYNYQVNRAENSASVSSGRSTAAPLHTGYAAPTAQTSRSTLLQTQERTPAPQALQHANQYYQQPTHVQTVYDGGADGGAQAASASHYSTGTGTRQVQKETRPVVDTTSHRHLPTPETTSQRRAESTTTAQTVDPTQVYDPYHDWQREHQRAEAEAKKRAEAETKQRIEMEAKQQADLAAKEQSEAETIQRAEAEAQQRASGLSEQMTAVTAGTSSTQPKKKAARKSDSTAPKRVRKKKADKQPEKQDEAQAAALTLLQAANGSSGDSQSEILQEQMREMFKKMREFNALDPDMLGRLWQEERDNHIGGQSTTTITTTKEPETSAPQSKPKSRQTASTKASTNVGIGNSTIQQPRPSFSHIDASPATKVSELASTAKPVPNQAFPATAPSTTASAAQPIWPADKKATLAIKAAELLSAANSGKTITSVEIAALLDKNPSYIELCEQIQGRGLTVDRAKLAKALLNAVPDINRHRTEKPAKSTLLDGAPVASMQTNSNSLARLMNGQSLVETNNTAAPAAVDGGKKRRTSKQKKAKQNENVKDSNLDPQLEGLDAVKHFVAGQWQPSAGTGEASTKKPQKAKVRPLAATPVLTKEGQARKRTFADLVDLSRVDSDEDMVDDAPFAKRLETEPLPAFETEEPRLEEPIQLPTPPPTDFAPTVPIMRGPRPAGFELAQVNASSSSVAPKLVSPQTVSQQQIIPRQQGIPSAPPQPVSTRPAVQPPVPVPLPTLPHHMTTMAKPLDRYKAIRRSSYDPRTIARDVLLASGRHPDMRHLNAHLEILKRTMDVDVNADLGTFRWDLADPGGPAPGSGAELPTPLAIEVHNDADDEDDSDNDSVVGGAGSRHALRQAIGVDGAASFETAGQRSQSHKKKTLPLQDGHGIRRRGPGRPATGSTPVQAGTPTGESPRGYAALRAQQAQLDENGQPIKKRGRPVGWRMHMMKNGPPAGTGTPSKLTKTQPKPPSPGPEYQVFLCDWEGCRAELHNLSTLRKHIHKVHGKPSANGDYKCVWTGCAKPSTNMEGGRSVTRWTHFSSKVIDQWKQHVEKKHLEPIAWKQGDGPAGGVSSASEAELSEAYLSDAHGRHLTPRVVVPAPPTAPASGPARSNAHEAALEVEREATKRKRAIGVGIDKGGARLVNDKRRQGFIDDDDTAMVVDNDE